MNKSRHRFGLYNETIGISGTLNKVSGRLDAVPDDFSKSKVFLRIDISEVSLDPVAGGLQLVSFEPLFRRIPSPVATFVSSRILPLDDGKYRVDGILERNGKRETVSVPVRLISTSANESKLYCKAQEHFSSLAKDFSLPLFPSGGRGELTSQLVFRVPGPPKDRAAK